jgi:citrate synthase
MSAASGLEGVVVAQTRLSAINGEKGELIYVGYEIDDLARNTTFEEVTYLLWHYRLPNKQELEDLHSKLVAERKLHPKLLELMRRFPDDADPMAVLRTAVSAMAF